MILRLEIWDAEGRVLYAAELSPANVMYTLYDITGNYPTWDNYETRNADTGILESIGYRSEHDNYDGGL
jgi:hypothetical protein